VALTAKQAQFVKEYLIDLNATQAAIRAGYSESTAGSQGQRMLTNVEIQAAIQEAMNKRATRTEVTADRVIEQLAKIAFHDLKHVVTWDERGRIKIRPSDEVDGTILQEISETISDSGMSKKVKLNDRMRALELLGKHLALFSDNIKLSGEVGVKIVDDIE
jgi:phage terminase small subunit